MKNKLLMLLAMVHLSFAALGAAMIPLGDPEHPSLLARYRHMTGTDNDFSFFAPGVGPQERLTFVLTDRSGHQWEETLRFGTNHESNMCFETVSFVLAATDDTTAQNMLESVCETMLRNHSSAVSVKARVETYAAVWASNQGEEQSVDFPRMQEFAEGKRPQWLLKYEFEHRPIPNAVTTISQKRGGQS